jgi:hypothetical protein
MGRLFGLILATPARPRMMSVYPILPGTNRSGLAMTSAFYDASDHRPEIVVIYSDVYVQPWNPMEHRFAEWYSLVKTQEVPLGTFQIFRKR